METIKKTICLALILLGLTAVNIHAGPFGKKNKNQTESTQSSYEETGTEEMSSETSDDESEQKGGIGRHFKKGGEKTAKIGGKTAVKAAPMLLL